MTVAYALGARPSATARGGDPRCRDLSQARAVWRPHRFAATSSVRICNGLLRATVVASGAAPALTVEAWAPGTLVTAATTYDGSTTYTASTTYTGPIYAWAWVAMGTLTLDSSAFSSVMTAARIAHQTSEEVTLRLVCAELADVHVTLRRGEPMLRIQHGGTGPDVSTTRRVRWTAGTSPSGVAHSHRVSEDTPATVDTPRFIASFESASAVNAGQFSMSTVATVATFGAGVGTADEQTSPADLHRQLRDERRPVVIVRRVPPPPPPQPPSYLLTESGDILTTESGDRIIL